MLHKIAAAVLMVSAAVALAETPGGSEFWNGAKIAWRSPADGLTEAKREGKIAMVVVQADWCPVCRDYRNVFKDNRIVEASRSVVPILIDTDKDPDNDAAFAPDGGYVPRTLFVDGNGKIIESLKAKHPDYRHFVDADAPDELLALLKRATEK